jgi:hypothetical protein
MTGAEIYTERTRELADMKLRPFADPVPGPHDVIRRLVCCGSLEMTGVFCRSPPLGFIPEIVMQIYA